MEAAMLSPDARSLYTSAVCPPPGYVFDQALATTYSLDPTTLLSLPTHLALAERSSKDIPDPIKLLESLRRLSNHFSIYVDHAGIQVPSVKNPLYGMLESILIPVRAPKGGVFHPKLWVLRFVQPDTEEPPLIRVLVLSRNLTYDRSWDISLQLEGQPGRYINTGNKELVEFLWALPSMSTRQVSEAQKQQAEMLAEEIRKTQWELPEYFESVYFSVLGHKRRIWEPPKSNRIVVISPFITDSAIKWLRGFTDEITAVVSRPDELNNLVPDTFQDTTKWYTLDESAESEDGEVTEEHDTLGLHAKAYVFEKGWDTILVIGSANATAAALLERKNIEILAELVARKSKEGIDKLLDENGLGQLLTPYARPEESSIKKDEEEIAAQKALDEAKATLSLAGLNVVCHIEGDALQLSLTVPEPLTLPGISSVKAWPITVSGDRAEDISVLTRANHAVLGNFAAESVTGLIAFVLETNMKNISARMVLNLPVEGLPENRDEAIFKLVVNNREGFLRYLLLLLGEAEGSFIDKGNVLDGGNGNGGWKPAFTDDKPLLEELARAFSRHPEKLKEVNAVVNRFLKENTTSNIIPEDFLKVWNVFEQAMKEVKS